MDLGGLRLVIVSFVFFLGFKINSSGFLTIFYNLFFG